ncbi:MAG TPA: hypothetical protein PLI45_01375 [Candidatus Woesebacteria bacterium]|nr:hypothetical protein [Candidatus Woesebacteria bacterium]
MESCKESIRVSLSKDELLGLFLGKSVSVKNQKNEEVILHDISHHRPIPGMIEGESRVHEIKAHVRIGDKDYESSGLLILDRGGNSFSGTFDVLIYPDNNTCD